MIGFADRTQVSVISGDRALGACCQEHICDTYGAFKASIHFTHFFHHRFKCGRNTYWLGHHVHTYSHLLCLSFHLLAYFWEMLGNLRTWTKSTRTLGDNAKLHTVTQALDWTQEPGTARRQHYPLRDCTTFKASSICLNVGLNPLHCHKPLINWLCSWRELR